MASDGGDSYGFLTGKLVKATDPSRRELEPGFTKDEWLKLDLRGKPLYLDHERSPQLGEITGNWIDEDWLGIDAKLYKTHPSVKGVYDRIKSGKLNSLSAGFACDQDIPIRFKRFVEASVTDDPVQDGARIYYAWAKNKDAQTSGNAPTHIQTVPMGQFQVRLADDQTPAPQPPPPPAAHPQQNNPPIQDSESAKPRPVPLAVGQQPPTPPAMSSSPDAAAPAAGDQAPPEQQRQQDANPAPEKPAQSAAKTKEYLDLLKVVNEKTEIIKKEKAAIEAEKAKQQQQPVPTPAPTPTPTPTPPPKQQQQPQATNKAARQQPQSPAKPAPTQEDTEMSDADEGDDMVEGEPRAEIEELKNRLKDQQAQIDEMTQKRREKEEAKMEAIRQEGRMNHAIIADMTNDTLMGDDKSPEHKESMTNALEVLEAMAVSEKKKFRDVVTFVMCQLEFASKHILSLKGEASAQEESADPPPTKTEKQPKKKAHAKPIKKEATASSASKKRQAPEAEEMPDFIYPPGVKKLPPATPEEKKRFAASGGVMRTPLERREHEFFRPQGRPLQTVQYSKKAKQSTTRIHDMWESIDDVRDRTDESDSRQAYEAKYKEYQESMKDKDRRMV